MRFRRSGAVLCAGLILFGLSTAVRAAENESAESETRVLVGAQPEYDWIRTKPARSKAWRIGVPVSVDPVPEVDLGLIPTLFRCDCQPGDFTSFELRGRGLYLLKSHEGTAFVGAQLGDVFRGGNNWESMEFLAGLRADVSKPAIFEFGVNLGWIWADGGQVLIYGAALALRGGF